ncbi:MAG: twitching motility protein PilT [Spirochaetes bacterium]|nr:twitching motility protein PilT [Spirochaetota bacterium]
MPRVSVHFRDGLEELLPRRRKAPVDVAAPPDSTAVAIVEDLGIPHTEVGSLLVNGRPAGLMVRPADGDELTVHPFGQEAERDMGSPRFVLDVHLGRLARLLRLLGFDAEWSRDADDAELAATASRENRILLSRDRGLLKRREVRRGCLVRSQDPRLQLDEVTERYRLRGHLAPFSRCLICNAPLDRPDAAPTGPNGSPAGGCPSCGRRYWRGSHWQQLNAIVEEIRGGAEHAG